MTVKFILETVWKYLDYFEQKTRPDQSVLICKNQNRLSLGGYLNPNSSVQIMEILTRCLAVFAKPIIPPYSSFAF